MPSNRTTNPDASPFYAIVAMLLGLLVAVLGLFALLMWVDARRHNNSAGTANVAMPSTSGGSLESYAGAAPADADARATAHKPFPAALPPAPAGPVANVNLVLTDLTVEIAPGVKYAAGPGPRARPDR